MRYLLHLLHVLTFCDALNEINGVLNSIIVFSIVFADEKRSLSPLTFDDVPCFLDWIQLATLGGQEHLLKLIVEDVPHYLCLVHLQIIHHN